jgi:hypothetical protein
LAPLPATAPEPFEAPFTRQVIKENTSQVNQGPDPYTPYFNQRALLPIPPETRVSRQVIDAAGLHPSFRGHNHSPALEVCPNGDVLMIIYTSYSEYEPGVSLMATRLRFGALTWDMPTPMFDFPGVNDHAPMLWTDNGTVHLFWGCPRLEPENNNPYPFQWISSTDSGATWGEVKFPEFIGGIGGHTRQPINSAFRDGNTIYVSSDGSGGTSVLWKSDDNGLTWYDPIGRTGGRHTPFALLDNGDILGMGGKNTDINGYMPKSVSSDGAQTWTVSSTPFSTLGGNQRPCIIKLASGNLFFCSDFQRMADCYSPPGITERGVLVALSDDEGQTWTIKEITSALPHESFACTDPTLGYSAARQAPNGIIHVISTMNLPCQHFEMNEAWILDGSAPPVPPADPGTSGSVSQYQEDYPGGGTKVTYGAKTCTDGRYLLHGTETAYYETGQKQYEVTYYNGQKVGDETYWSPDGVVQWSWDHNEPNDISLWTQYWPNGFKRVESRWRYGGMIANGDSYHWSFCGLPEEGHSFTDGFYDGPTDLPESQTNITADVTGDCTVNESDLRVLAMDWLDSGYFIPTTEPNSDELQLHFMFEDSSSFLVTDSSGNNRYGYFFTDVDLTFGDVSTRSEMGRTGNSFHFWPGLGTAGIWLNPTIFTAGGIIQEITVSLWIKNSHVDETPDMGAYMWEFRQWDGSSVDTGPRVLAVETTDRNDNFVFHDDSESTSYGLDWSGQTEWTHYGFVRDTGNLRTYVNGSLEAIGNSSGNPMDEPGIMYLGVSADRAPGNTSGLHDGFTGNIDDFQIYGYALSENEILNIVNDGGDAYIPVDSLADLYKDGSIDFKDMAVMGSQWLEGI